jgi:hypothetical protein
LFSAVRLLRGCVVEGEREMKDGDKRPADDCSLCINRSPQWVCKQDGLHCLSKNKKNDCILFVSLKDYFKNETP